MDTSRVLRSAAASESYKYLLDVLRELGAFVGVLPMRLLESSEHRRELLAPPVVPRQPPVVVRPRGAWHPAPWGQQRGIRTSGSDQIRMTRTGEASRWRIANGTEAAAHLLAQESVIRGIAHFDPHSRGLRLITVCQWPHLLVARRIMHDPEPTGSSSMTRSRDHRRFEIGANLPPAFLHGFDEVALRSRKRLPSRRRPMRLTCLRWRRCRARQPDWPPGPSKASRSRGHTRAACRRPPR